MIYACLVPEPPLDAFADLLWYYNGIDATHQRERVLPDGTFELIINLRDEPRRLYPRDLHGPALDFKRAWVSGTHTEYIVIDVVPSSELIGVHFRPGGAAAVLDMPADLLRDQVVELDALWGPDIREWRERLLSAPLPAQKLRLLGNLLVDRIRAHRSHDRAVGHALRRFRHSPHMLTIDGVASELGLSHKHLIARFRATVGLTPKRFCRIQRFQEVLRCIERQPAVDWADLAAACGYFDQSHFIQEFRGFSGLNPAAYLRDRGDYMNFVPLQESTR